MVLFISYFTRLIFIILLSYEYNYNLSCAWSTAMKQRSIKKLLSIYFPLILTSWLDIVFTKQSVENWVLNKRDIIFTARFNS